MIEMPKWMRGMRMRVLQRLIKGFFDQRNDIGWAHTHSSSTCFMRTDTLHTSLVTTVLPQGRASRHMQAFKLRRKKENKKKNKGKRGVMRGQKHY